jgi:hypothetical protein
METAKRQWKGEEERGEEREKVDALCFEKSYLKMDEAMNE